MRTTAFVVLTIFAALPSARAQTIVEYPIPTPLSKPTGITAGPDGNLWFTEMGCSVIGGVCLSKIGKITTSGVITEYTIPTPESYPAGIAAGPDGNLWFCEQQGSKIGRITPSGVITEYPVPTSGSQPYGITAGPDGNLWFTEWLSGKVGKITPDGVITEYATGSYGFAYGITAGPDGRLWFGSSVVGILSAITTNGVVSNFNLTYNAGVLGIAAGPDSNIWYTSKGGTIARSSPNSPQLVTQYALNPDEGAQLLGMITRGPANDLWFTVEYGQNGLPLIGRITTAGEVTEFPLSNTTAAPLGIATGPDGNIWFTEYGGNAIGVAPVSSPGSSAAVTVSQRTLTFSGVAGGAAASQTFSVTSSSATPFTATANTPVGTNWLEISPSGNLTTNQIITVTADPSGINNTGAYTGTIEIASGNVTQIVTVTLNVSAPTAGNVKTDYTSLSLAYTTGGALSGPQSLNVTSAVGMTFPTFGSYDIPFTVSASVLSPTGGNWLSISSGSQATTPAVVSLAVNPAGLAPGAYNGTVTIRPAGGSPLAIPVNLTVASAPVLVANPTSLSLDYSYGDPSVYSRSIQVTEQSGLNAAFTVALAGSPGSWMSVSPASGATPHGITLSITPGGVAPGVYTARVNITPATGSAISVPVSVTIEHPPLAASVSNLTFSFVASGPAPSAQSIEVTSPSGASALTISDLSGYLSVSPSATITPASISVSLSAAGLRLAPGSYADYVGISQSLPGGPGVSIPVTINVAASGSFVATPASLDLSYQIGASPPIPQTIQLTVAGGNSAVPFTASAAGTGWLLVSSASAATPSAITVSIVTANLNPGVYTGTIFVNSTNPVTALEIPVKLTVSAAPSISATPASLSFTTPQPQTVQVAAAGGAALQFTATAISTGEWLSVTPASGTTPATLQVSVASSGLAPGQYSGSISINGGAVTIAVNLTVTASTPVPTIVAVVNAASFASGPVAPGEIVTLGGTALGPSAALGLQLDPTGKVATTLGGVTVSFSGYPAPLIYVSETQINCVVPYEIAGESNPQVQVQYAALTSNAFPLQLAAAAPGIFTQNGSGTGLAAALNSANCPAAAATCGNSSSTPAPQGSAVVIYATGEGLTNPPGVTGVVTTVDSTTGDPLTPQPQAPLTVTIGGQLAAVTFFGEAPGLVAGVLQINVQVPTGLGSGTLPLVVSLGRAASQSGVTIAVQ